MENKDNIYLIPQTYLSGVDDNGFNIYSVQNLSLKTYIKYKLNNSFSKEHAIYILGKKNGMNLNFEKVKEIRKTYESFINEIIDKFNMPEDALKLAEHFDFIGVTKSIYVRSGMPKEEFTKLLRQKKIKVLEEKEGVDHNYKLLSLKQFVEYLENRDCFNCLKSRKDWLEEGFEVNKVKQMNSLQKNAYTKCYTKDEVHKASEEELAEYAVFKLKNRINKKSMSLKRKGKEEYIKVLRKMENQIKSLHYKMKKIEDKKLFNLYKWDSLEEEKLQQEISSLLQKKDAYIEEHELSEFRKWF